MLPLRKIVLAGGLLVTVAASFIDWPGSDGDAPEKTRSVAAPRAHVPALHTVPKQLPPQDSVALRAPFEAPVGNLFAPHGWQPPAVQSAKVAPSAPPSAPPLPFRYLGKTLEQGAITAFVSHGTRTLVLHRGDVLAEYRVDDITPTEMTLVYLPLNEAQRLIFGSSN